MYIICTCAVARCTPTVLQRATPEYLFSHPVKAQEGNHFTGQSLSRNTKMLLKGSWVSFFWDTTQFQDIVSLTRS